MHARFNCSGNGVNVAVTEDHKQSEAGQKHSSLNQNSLLTGKGLIGSISAICIYAFHDIAYTEVSKSILHSKFNGFVSMSFFEGYGDHPNV